MSDIITKTLRSGFLIIAFSLTIKGVSAQTCGTPPTCDSLGYTKTVDDCSGEVLKCPFDTSKLFCVDSEMQIITIGAILYSDKTVISGIVTGKTPIGVVFDTNKRLAVALDQASSTLTWGGYGADVPTLANCKSSTPSSCGTDGKSNTSAIIAYGKSKGISYPAAEYCASYNTSGTEAGDWFLPSMEELSSIYNAKNSVNASLTLLGKPALGTDYYHWSSTEYTFNYSWRLTMGNGGFNGSGKSNGDYVRPVVAF